MRAGHWLRGVMSFAEIAIPSAVFSTFTYVVPDGVTAIVGARYLVSFGRRKVIGVCLDVSDSAPTGGVAGKLKEIGELLDEEPAHSAKSVELIKWMAAYYCTPVGEVLRASLPPRMLKHGAPKTTRPNTPHELSPASFGTIIPNEHQLVALEKMKAAAIAREHKAFLLYGVTGSGKTEVYLSFFESLKTAGLQSLLLVPEINLTPQLTARATARFGDRVAVYHSGLTDAQRHEQWKRIRRGEVDVVIGTRSALFAPLQRLGAIVVDEEHDQSFKQDEGFTYSARDCAVVRSKIEGAVCVLGSATPSLESVVNVQLGKYEKLTLPLRTAGAVMPDIEIVDMCARIKRGKEKTEGQLLKKQFHALSPRLYDGISDALTNGGQVLLYVGRRGFAGHLQCGACGTSLLCPNCDISLTLHSAKGLRGKERLVCHYCGYAIAAPEVCPDCGSDEISPIGVGTERLEAEIADFFPDAKVARLDSDTTQKISERKRIMSDLHSGEIDILVGTQMITKGHDCHAITLVGVISADLSLSIPDFRAGERTFQLITQVAGRAGRGEQSGRVIVQTRKPTHQSLVTAAANDFDRFVEEELAHRREMDYPPFARLANVRLTAVLRSAAIKAAECAAKILNEECRRISGGKMKVLGPAPAAIEKLRGGYRWQVLIKSPAANLITAVLSSARPKIAKAIPARVRLTIDVDPIGML